MARQFRRRAAPAPEARRLAAAIQDARRRGYSNQVIADSFGINERTVRKIIAGETPGTRIIERHSPPPDKRVATPNVFRLDLRVAPGEVRTVNVRLPDIPGAGGKMRAPTAFDVFRYPDLLRVADAERAAMARRYGFVFSDEDEEATCERSYCLHLDLDHYEDEDGKQPCNLCHCPDFLTTAEFDEPAIAGLRPVVQRNPAKRLVTIRGAISS